MQQILIVGAGGFVGAVLRYVVSGLVQKRFPGFPEAGTIFVNVLGCFAVGILTTLVTEQSTLSPGLRLLVITGLLGSMTTFSTFGYETMALVQAERPGLAAITVFGNLVPGLVAVWLGHLATEALAT